MLQFSSSVSSHIRSILNNSNESNCDFEELCQLTGSGIEGRILLLQTCLDQINIYGADTKKVQVDQVTVSVFKFLLDKPYFSTVLCQSLKSALFREGFLDSLCDAFSLSVCESISVGLALTESGHPDARICGKNFCMAKIEDYLVNPGATDSIQQIQNIFSFLHQSEGLSKHVDTFAQMLNLVPLVEQPYSVAPLISDQHDESNILRNLDLFYDHTEIDFDAIVAEMEEEMSMADVMKELGYGCTVDASRCKDILSLYLPLTELTIARILGTLARNHTGLGENQSTFSAFVSVVCSSYMSDLPSLSSWSINILVESIKELAPNTRWTSVVENLDHEEFYIPDEAAFAYFMSVYKHACQDSFPLNAICGSVWRNAEGQLSFLKHAVAAPPELFTFSHSVRQLANVDVVHDLKLQVGQSNHAWLCIDLLEVLCQLAERGHAAAVRMMLEHPKKQCPEVLLLGMAHVNTSYNLIQYEVSSSVFPAIIGNGNKSNVILHLWHVNPSLVLRSFVDVLNTGTDSIFRILDICQEVKILSPVLERIPFTFGIRLAAVASQKELLDLERWLTDSLVTFKEGCFEECLKYLKEVQLLTVQPDTNQLHHSGEVPNMYSPTTLTILKVLRASSCKFTSNHICEELEKLNIFFKHGNVVQQNDGVTESTSSTVYANDIEKEVNSYFQQLFSEEFTVDEMVKIFASFKDSSEKRKQKLFDCMIANLFEEYRFLSKYPDKQLALTAILFGSLINHQLVTHITLGVALRCVLDALRKPPDSKMFAFGAKALEQFIRRLDEWMQYCNHILQISHLRSTNPELVAYIEGVLARNSRGANGTSVDQLSNSSKSSAVNEPLQQGALQDGNRSAANINHHTKPPLSSAAVVSPVDSTSVPKLQNATTAPALLSSSPGFSRPTCGITSARFGSALNIETLVAAAERRETPIEAPSSEVQDRISFMINNISAANIEAKAIEYSDILKEQYYPWFAQYMVMKRASIEPNFHELYLQFFDKIDSKALIKEIVQATYENCKVLLGSELIKSSSEERSLLKNLGSWLGKLTIGKNQVLRARDIDPKSLIIEAYEKGLMIAVIPFTSKILEPCQSSLAYQPPNPWTMGILALLTEIYAMPNLKMNLKFDIEVLFKNLSVNMKDVKPTNLLKDRARVIGGNPDFSNKDIGVTQPAVVAEDKSVVISALNQVELPVEVASPSHLGVHPHSKSSYASATATATLIEEGKVPGLGFSDQPQPAAQGLQKVTASHSPYNIGPLPSAISNIGAHVVVNPKLSSLGLHLHFQRVLPLAMERAINEIVLGIVQRSVSIATQTTKELVMKDYAVELDESRIYNAAHLMVASLAGSLAHVTCKEPLRASISSQLRNTFQGISITSEFLDQAVQLVSNDNLDLGCAYIEQAATEKAVHTIDGEIAQQLSLRRKQGFGSSLFNENLYPQVDIGVLPETLRPKPGRLSLSQQRVYEDFVRLPWQNQQPTQNTNALLTGHASSNVSLARMYSSPSGQHNPGLYSSNVAYTGSGVDVQPLDISDEMDARSVQIPSAAPLNQARPSESIAHQRSEIDSTVFPSPLPVSVSEQSVEYSNILKESRVPSLPTPSDAPSVRVGTAGSEPLFTTGEALEKYHAVAMKLESFLSSEGRETEIQVIVSEVPQIILHCVSRDEAALAVAQEVFGALYENAAHSLHIGAHLAILAAVRDVCKHLVKELTSWVLYLCEERKFHKDITVGLIRRRLLNLAEYDIHMSKLLDAGRHKAATNFAISLTQTLLIEEPKVLSELHNLVVALGKLATRPGSPNSSQQLVELARNHHASAGLISGTIDEILLSGDKKASVQPSASRGDYTNVDLVEHDTSGFHEQVSKLFMEWLQICEHGGANDSPGTNYILQLHQNGLLKGDETSDHFFRILLELCVSHCLQSSQQGQQLSFLAIDTYAKLALSVLKYYPVEQSSSKLILLPKILGVIVKFIQKDAEEKKTHFNPRPYFRLFIDWLSDIGSLDAVHDGMNLQILSNVALAFLQLQPIRIPAFSFAWLELVSHRTFMPKLLIGNSQKGWPILHRLLVALFQFMEPFLRNAELGELIGFLYKGTLRVLLVLLHDFPEFLCDYHFSFCDVIPPSCIQMRNIILSAFPRNMRLPDPSTPNLKIDLLQEMSQVPRILSEVDWSLKTKLVKTEVDEYLKSRQGASFLGALKQKLLLSQNEATRAGIHYNVPLINSLVLYVGMQAAQQLHARNPPQQQSMSNGVLVDAALDMFKTLILELDTEGRYLFLNAIANQLRYPNNHTHYFSRILLGLFSDANQEIIQEQITRVLLERLIASRPQPWGLLVTAIELIKNPEYNFWKRSFIRCAPEIEKLFESLSRSCAGLKPVSDCMAVSGGLSDSIH